MLRLSAETTPRGAGHPATARYGRRRQPDWPLAFRMNGVIASIDLLTRSICCVRSERDGLGRRRKRHYAAIDHMTSAGERYPVGFGLRVRCAIVGGLVVSTTHVSS